MNPLKGKMCLPIDCADWESIEWSEPPATLAATPETVSPVPKSLCKTLGELVAAVRSFKRRPAHPLASARSCPVP
jgi:hypothetical protein